MKTGHSVGPLRAEKTPRTEGGENWAIVDGLGKVIGIAYSHAGENEMRPAAGNATLWAAAPDLRLMLSLIVSQMDRFGNWHGEEFHYKGIPCPELRALIHGARQLLDEVGGNAREERKHDLTQHPQSGGAVVKTEASVVRIGNSTARILSVAPQSVDYIDDAGQKHSVDLKECARNWGRLRGAGMPELRQSAGSSEQLAAWNSRCVGQRGALDHPPWAEFMDEQRTRFEFATYEALYQELLTPLRRAGWQTFDTN